MFIVRNITKNAIKHEKDQLIIKELEDEIEDTSIRIIKSILISWLLASHEEEPEKAVELLRKIKSL